MRLLYLGLLVFISQVTNASPLQKDTTPAGPYYIPDFSAPPDAPYTAEEVRIKTAAGHTLAGTLTLPKNSHDPARAVVTITGSSPQDRDHNTTDGNGDYHIFRQLADSLGRRGIAVLRMDDRGVGASTGDFWSATTADRADDIREGIAFLRSHQQIDSSKIVLVGLSEGGMIAPIIAANDTALAGIVLLAGPASTGKEILAGQIRYRINLQKQFSRIQRDSAFKTEEGRYFELSKTNPWVKYFWSYDPAAMARKVSAVPVLILQGTTDRNVPWKEAKKLKKAFKDAGNNHVQVKILKNLNHLFLADTDGNPEHYSLLPSFQVSPTVIGIIVDWVSEIQSIKKVDQATSK